MKTTRLLLICAILLPVAGPALAAPVVFAAAGVSAAAIQSTVDNFRSSVGALNANQTGSLGSGRREINWDGVPDGLADPNNLPGNFFNSNSPRGVELTTPGTGFQVSANAGVAPIEFGNIDASYPGLFTTFSAQRLFTAVGSNITDVAFFIPGTNESALTDAFGVVFTDVDSASSTSLEFFDVANSSLGIFAALPLPGRDETLSFLGVQFSEGKVVSRVRITSGNATDAVVMDDFIYGEPVAALGVVAEPGTLSLFALALLAAGCVGARRRA